MSDEPWGVRQCQNHPGKDATWVEQSGTAFCKTCEPQEAILEAIKAKQTELAKEARDALAVHAQEEAIVKYFAYEHLPAFLQLTSKPFADLALHILSRGGRCEERTVALRKLLEAKDAAVRAALP